MIKIKADMSALMDQILCVRFEDPEEELRLCRELLTLSEAEGYHYGCAFAYVYMLDSCLGLGDYPSMAFCLSRAQSLCEKFGFADLHMSLCNFAGLYSQHISEEINALGYFLQGLEFARQTSNPVMQAKFLNNIGFCFSSRADYPSTKFYLQAALDVICTQLKGELPVGMSCTFTNLAELAQLLGNAEDSLHYLRLCDTLHTNDPYFFFRLNSAWCGHYALLKDRESAAKHAMLVLDSGIAEFEDRAFIINCVTSVCEYMLSIENAALAKRAILVLEDVCATGAMASRVKLQQLKIKYYQFSPDPVNEAETYRVYYELCQTMQQVTYQARVESMLSKLKLEEELRRHAEVLRQNAELENSSNIDELTGLYNRRYFNRSLTKSALSSHERQIGLIMLDVDYFKQYNDTYGHFMGDSVLRTVSRVLRSCCAGADIRLCRYGGDEFVSICYDLTLSDMEDFVRRVQSALAAEAVPHNASPAHSTVSLSIGFSHGVLGAQLKITPDELLELADQALYDAKERGRNTYAFRLPS